MKYPPGTGARDALLDQLSMGHNDQDTASVLLDAYRTEILIEAADRLYAVVGSDEGAEWNWWDAATIPESCGRLIDPRIT